MGSQAQEPDAVSSASFNFWVVLVAVGQVIVEQVRGVWVLSLVGEHDLGVEPSPTQRLERAFAAGSTVIVDLTEAEFMDSSVLRALAYGAEQAEGVSPVRIVAPRDGFPRRLLALTAVPQARLDLGHRAVALAAVEQAWKSNEPSSSSVSTLLAGHVRIQRARRSR